MIIHDICLSMIQDSKTPRLQDQLQGATTPRHHGATAPGFQAQGPHGDSTIPSTTDAETASNVETQGLGMGSETGRSGERINGLGYYGYCGYSICLGLGYCV